MLVARQSFVCEYDGEALAVHRGRTRVADDHEVAKRYPHRFEPVPEREQQRYRDGGLYRTGGSIEFRPKK